MTNQPTPSLPGDIKDIDQIFPASPITPGEEKVPVGQPFSSFMQEAKGAPPAALSGKTAMVSPFDLPSHGMPLATSAPTLDTVMTQVKNAQGTLGDLSTFMNTPGLKLKASQKYLLKNKMTDANANLRAANTKLEAKVPDEPSVSQFPGPLGKFLAYLSDSQNQLEAATTQIQDMKEKGKTLQPADFLLIQVKLNKAQQELEYSSVLLSNVVSSIKQLMQVQL